ncbi:MAG: hypothetical protein WKG07_29065 [Hymenobacter sp.]
MVFTAANAASAYAEQYEGLLVRINGLTSLTTNPGSWRGTPGSLATASCTTYRPQRAVPLATYVPGQL